MTGCIPELIPLAMIAHVDELPRLICRIADFKRRMLEQQERLERPDSGWSVVEGATMLELLTRTASAIEARQAELERLLQQEAIGDTRPQESATAMPRD
jgi:acyl-CoA reductase-like NAD-dependent aldehyde dehydrogenase